MVVREKEVVLGAGQGGRRAAQQLARARPGLRGRMRNTLRRPTAQRSGGTQGTERVITNLKENCIYSYIYFSSDMATLF